MDLSRDKQHALLKTYEPALKFNQGENSHPIPIKEYLRYCRLKQKGWRGKDETANWIGATPPRERTSEQLEKAAEKLQTYSNTYYLQFVQSEAWAKRFWIYPLAFAVFFLALWLATGWSWHVLASVLLALTAVWYAKTVARVVRVVGGLFAVYALAMGSLRLTAVAILALSDVWLGWIAGLAGSIVFVGFLAFTGSIVHPELEEMANKAAQKRILHRMRITSRVSLNLMVAMMIASLALQRTAVAPANSAGQIFLWTSASLLFAYDLFGLPGFLLSLFSGLPPDAVVSARQQFVSIRNRKKAEGEKIYHIYGRVKEDGEFIVLQYFFFYAFNDWRTAAKGLNQHEADWEMAAVFLEKAALAAWDGRPHLPLPPSFVALSQHELGDYRPWSHDELQKEGMHPIIYVALGSHANYFTPGRKPILAEQLGKKEMGLRLAASMESIYESPREFMALYRQHQKRLGLDDTLSDGTAVALQTSEVEIDLQELAEGDGMVLGVIAKEERHHWQLNVLDAEDGRLPGWVKYQGFWGRTSIPGESGPSGPMWDGKNKERERWENPAQWLDRLRS